MERVVFDEDGQFLTGSFTDYALPRALDAVPFRMDSHPVPAKTNPLGAKGCGEAGCAGSLPAVMNAVVDALSEYGIRHIDMPATPFKVWQAIQAAYNNRARAVTLKSRDVLRGLPQEYYQCDSSQKSGV